MWELLKVGFRENPRFIIPYLMFLQHFSPFLLNLDLSTKIARSPVLLQLYVTGVFQT